MAKTRQLFATRADRIILKLSSILSVLFATILLVYAAQAATRPKLQQQTVPAVVANMPSAHEMTNSRAPASAGHYRADPPKAQGAQRSGQAAALSRNAGLATAADGITIIGPSSGALNTTYTFTATVRPSDATTPLTYTWQTDGPARTIIHTNRPVSDSITLQWETTGTRVLTVTASNVDSTTTATRTIPIQMPMSSIDISGPSVVAVNTSATYTTTVGPLEASTPVTYTWLVNDPSQGIIHRQQSLSDTLVLQWARPGTQTITVTATNMDPQQVSLYGLGQVSKTYTVTVAAPPTQLEVRGPATGTSGQEYSFTATTSPDNVTTPLTYIWQASDQPAQTVPQQPRQVSRAFTWETPGTKSITVTAKNSVGQTTASHQITLQEPAPQLEVAITGPRQGESFATYTFTATIRSQANGTPDIQANPPVYTWQFADQSPIVHERTALVDTVRQSWRTTGAKTFSVTVENWDNISATHTIELAQGVSKLYLPLVMQNKPQTIYGFETSPGSIAKQSLLQRAKELNPSWIRLKSIHWRDVQPQEGGAYDWSALETFEQEIQAANDAQLTPIAIVHLNPSWALKEGESAPCAAVASEHFDAYAQFLQALATRYSKAPYNVHYWELGNEPDVDPSLLSEFLHEHFGCWGDVDDPYYGGKHYGEMLKVVAPAIKQADPSARIVLGGLLLDNPDTTQAGAGKPERFLAGILETGAGNSFDIVGYHAYPGFGGRTIDTDLHNDAWESWGGSTIGKAAYIRQALATHGLQKPLFLTEAALLLYTAETIPDNELPDEFLQAQADHVVRQLTRALFTGVDAYSWYTLHKSGWNYSGLLNGDNSPRPAYTAYKQYIEMIGQHRPTRTDDYGDTVVAYRFDKGSEMVDVLWVDGSETHIVDVPTAQFQAAYTRDGAAITPIDTGEEQKIEVTIEPVYIVRTQ